MARKPKNWLIPAVTDRTYWRGRGRLLEVIAVMDLFTLIRVYHDAALSPTRYTLREREEPEPLTNLGINFVHTHTPFAVWSPLSSRLLRLRRARPRTRLESY